MVMTTAIYISNNISLHLNMITNGKVLKTSSFLLLEIWLIYWARKKTDFCTGCLTKWIVFFNILCFISFRTSWDYVEFGVVKRLQHTCGPFY